ncbi:MAG: hypothetical protein HY509_00320, partial [Acidobacteria bacterium]|nr:hypothetical protein [Acidobacteriota bacterium]
MGERPRKGTGTVQRIVGPGVRLPARPERPQRRGLHGRRIVVTRAAEQA